MAKSWLWILVFFFITVFSGFSQSRRSSPYELIIGLGSSNFFGDIGGTADEENWFGLKDLRLNYSRPSLHVGFRYFMLDKVALRGSLTVSMFTDSDKGSKNEERGFVFSTYLAEPAVMGEYFVFRDVQMFGPRVNRKGLLRNYSTFSLYIFAGIGGVFYHVNPNEALAERQVALGIKPGIASIVLPAGAGIKYGIRDIIDIGIETGGRYAFTDRLEGYTSKFSRAKDIYYLTHINVIYRFPFR